MRRVLAAAVMAASLGGCATELMTEEECLAGDWFAAGLEDGREGRLRSAFDKRALLCHDYNVGADEIAYEEGRSVGLENLCTPGGGYDYGRAGKSYLGVCRPETEPGFVGAYLEGWRVRRAESAYASAQSAYNSAVSRVESYRQDIRRARKTLHDDEASEKEIRKARKRLERARKNLPQAQDDVDYALYELGRADEALARTLGNLPAWRRSREYAAALAALTEAQSFARAEEVISFCTDESRDGENVPSCDVATGAVLRDRESGKTCVSGPAKLLLSGRVAGDPVFPDAAFIHSYRIHPRDESGRSAWRGTGYVAILFNRVGAYMGAACPALEEPS